MKTTGEKSGPSFITADWINAVLGIWVAISPMALGFSRAAARWNNVAVGLAILLLVVMNALKNGAFSGCLMVLGIWLFASPFALGFSRDSFLSNNVGLAFVIIAAAAISDELRATYSLTRARPG